jgi:hypothetical protein
MYSSFGQIFLGENCDFQINGARQTEQNENWLNF